MNRSLLPIILTLFLCIQAFGQQSQNAPCENKRAKKYYSEARAADRLGQQALAIEKYEKCLKICPEWPRVQIDLAIFYMRQDNYQAAENILSPLCNQNPPATSVVCHLLGNAQMALTDYEGAVKSYDKYLAGSHKNAHTRRMANKRKRDANFSIQAMSNPFNIRIEPLNGLINSPLSEYLPSLTADESLLFFTRREHMIETLYWATKVDSIWIEPKIWELSNAPFRKAACSVSPDGQLLVFAMADHPNGFGNFDLYYSILRNGKWSQAINFGRSVNTPGWESQPSIGPDGRTVYFATNRRGGHGGHDIWRTKLEENGVWSFPINLGRVVNSPFDEESPFLHRDGRTLYFRSDGHPGLGDFDVFLSRKEFMGWSTPLNLGYPINSVGSEGGMYVGMNGENALYGTDRRGGELKQIDLFSIELPKHMRPTPASYFQLYVFDCESDDILKARYTVLDVETADTLHSGLTDQYGYAFFCLPKDRNLSIYVDRKGYTFFSDRFELTGLDEDKLGFSMTARLCPVVAPSEEQQPVILKNVLFETASAKLLTSSFTELNRLHEFLRTNMELNIEIQGHTDSVGETDFNETLSESRAQAVYNYLITKGIDENRLSYFGFGESQPVASNDTVAGRRLNRRTSFLIKIQ